MKKFIALLFFSGSLFAAAANAQCPEISLTGPAGIVPPDRTMKFTVTVGRVEKDPPLKYVWNVSSGIIVTGQGTPSIEVKRKGTTLTASVEIDGLPENCPNSASETGWFDPAPTPIKVGVWKNEADLTPVKQFVAEMAIEPGHQGYVFIVRGPSSTQESLNELRNTVLSFGPKEQNGDSPRITIIESEGPDELAEIWCVPPGASNPECESCRKPECPEPTLIGSIGPPAPGELLRYSLSLKGKTPGDVSFKWAVNVGQIVSGQGTKTIQILPAEDDNKTRVVTVEILGLPPSCTTTLSEMAPIIDYEQPVLIDEFDMTPAFPELNRLKTAVEELKNNPANQLFVILYFPSSESQFKVREVINKLTDFFEGQSDLGNERYSIISSPSDKYRLKIYRIPPGASNPTP